MRIDTMNAGAVRRTFLQALAACFLQTLFVLPVLADDRVVIEAVQPPAWLERDGSYQAILPGEELRKGDALVTGGGGRMSVRLGDDGQLRQGAATRLSFSQLRSTGADQAGLKALINVEAGAMNVETGSGSKARHIRIQLNQLEVDLTAASTRFSGETEKELDIACLLAGSMKVKQGEQAEDLGQPGQCYVLQLSGEKQRIDKQITSEQAEMVAAITASNSDRPVIRQQGSWAVNVASFEKQNDARQFMELLYKAGYPAAVSEVTVKGRPWNRISVPGFANKSEANRYKVLMQETFGAQSAWIAPR